MKARLVRAHGRSLVRNVFGDRWVSRLDELGDARVDQLTDAMFEELARSLRVDAARVRVQVAAGKRGDRVKRLLGRQWPTLASMPVEQLLSRSVADMARLGSVNELAMKLGVDRLALRRRIRAAHGRSDAASALADLLPEAVPKVSAKLICGRFLLKGEPKKGGMGFVYEAIDHKMRPPRRVILKWAHAHSRSFAVALRKELAKAKDLAHPGLVKYFGEFQDEKGAPFLELEHGGVDLRAVLDEGPLPWRDAVVLVRQIADALDYMHDRGLVHLDVSAGNIVVDDSRRARLTDFGISRRVLHDTGAGHLTSTVTSWNPLFGAPELSRDGDAERSADQYSLALVFLACIHGYDVFRDAQQSGERAKLVSGARYAAVRKALSLKPKERFGSVGAFVDTLASDGESAGWVTKFLTTVLA